jgi:hypothetical protein
MTITIPARVRRTGMAVRFVLETGQYAAAGAFDQKLVVAIAKARVWWKKLQTEPSLKVTGLAALEGTDPAYVDHILRLAFLSPAVIDAILSGAAPAELNLNRLKDVKLIAPSGADQHRLLGVQTARG